MVRELVHRSSIAVPHLEDILFFFFFSKSLMQDLGGGGSVLENVGLA